jgi:biopolymer transport protein ExbD
MARGNRGRTKRRGADIDITPLIDILFMLIIFFVLAASFLQGRLIVELPQGKGETAPTEKLLLVNLARDGSILWGDVVLSAPVVSEDLFRLARESLSAEREILVAGDRSVPYGEVAALLDALRDAGVSRLGLALQGARIDTK